MPPQNDCIDFHNPATGQKFGQVRMTTEAEVQKARREMGAAQAAWAARPVKERARLLKKLQGCLLYTSRCV